MFQPGLIDGFNRNDAGFKNYLKARRNFINDVINTDYKYFTDQHAGSGSDTVEKTDPGKVQVQVTRPIPVHEAPATDTRTLLFARIESMTGFSRESFKDDMRLLDDFNLDSIKSGALLSGVSKSLNITGKISNTELANASLGEIIRKMEQIVRSQPVAVKTSESSAKDHPENDVPKIVFDMLSSRTGFPVEALKPEYKLLDDLNLDSIKAGAFTAELSKRFNISGKLSTAGMANATIEDIIKKVTALIPAETAKPFTASLNDPVQAKAYSVTLVEEPVRVGNHPISEFWKNKSLAIAYAGNFEKQVEDLIRCLKTRIDKVVSVESNNLHLLTSLENTCILVYMPREAVDSANLDKIVDLLAAVARKYEDAAMLGFIQFNDGRFLREINYQEPAEADYSAVSFAASLHHERPDIKIRVIEADSRISDEVTAGIILNEFATELSFDTAGYDVDLIRRTMKYGPAHVTISRKTEAHFNERDVIVATGGAKGITAACTLAFAGRYLCKTALVGSSPLNDEIENTLQQYRQKNLTVLYYPCDISDIASVKQTTEKIEHDLGEITVVIHGAGKNIPRRASQVLSASALSEIGPKLSGAMNLCEALKEKHLKYFVALTSIIGITGMPGNSWYAFSNENLDLYLRATGKKRHFKVRTIAYSIWDEIGMGARMGSNQVLAGMGIGSIPPAQGVEHFLQWIEHDTRDQQVAVSAEMGSLDTWNVLRPRLPEAKRYISDIRFFEPGKELITRVKLSRTTDLYLDDHNYNGSLLFPTVFGLEAMAQAAFLLSGIDGRVSVTFENISLIKPIVVPDTGDTEIEIKAAVIDEQIPSAGYPRIYVGISTEHSGFSTFHFSSEITFIKQAIPETREIELSTPLMICPETDLYTWLLFQGPKFQNIKKVYTLNSGRTEFLSGKPEGDPAVSCFAADVRTPFLLGSPLLRDVLLQSVQLFLTKKRYLPVAIKRWEISAFGQQGDNGYVISELRSLDEERGICDVGFVVNGQVTERIEGYSVKALESTSDYPAPDQIADLQLLYEDAIAGEFEKYMSLAEQRIEYRIYKNDEEFNKLDAASRHAIEDKVFETMIPTICENEQVKEVKIVRAPNGKPSISNSDKEISISHSRSLLFITAGPGQQGCDIEYIDHRKQDEWDDMLDNKYGQVLEQLKIIDNDYDLSATRIWCVREALIKSMGMIPLIIGIEKVYKNGVIFRIRTGEQSDIMVLTFSAKILPNTSVVISTLVSLNETGKSLPESHAGTGTYTAGFDKSIGAFTHDFLTTFKDCKGFFGKSHYTNYPDWMGSLRELVLAPIADELLNDLGSGNFGMVTNSSEVQIFNQADTLNHLTGKLWITGMSDFENSFIDLHFEFTKNVPGSNIQLRLAKCSLSTTWVKIESRGVVKKSPIPDYFREFLNKYLVQQQPDNPLVHVDGYPGMEGLGNVIYEGKQAVRPQTLLMEKEFATGISNGNTVGNLYYSNYYNWQSGILEQYLFQLAPEIMLSGGHNGEFLTLRSNVNHLQEAMPFEAIVVSMYIDKVYENGLKFYFEYFSKTGSGNRKLAYGSNTVIWCRRQDEKHVPLVRALPETILNPIMGLIVV